MPFASEWLYRRLGWRYFWAYAAFDVLSALLTTLATLGLFVLYTDASFEEFLRAFGVASLCVTLALVWLMSRARKVAWPIVEWLRAGRPRAGALDAWERAARLPRDFVVTDGWQPFLIVGIPLSIFM